MYSTYVLKNTATISRNQKEINSTKKVHSFSRKICLFIRRNVYYLQFIYFLFWWKIICEIDVTFDTEYNDYSLRTL